MDEKNKNNFPSQWPMRLTVKTVIVNKEGKILLLKRAINDKTNPGAYDLPGGGLEKGETIELALKREIEEETGIKNISIGDVIKISEYPKGHKDLDHLKGIRFIAYVGEENESIKLSGAEHSDFEWLPLEEAIKKLKKDGFEGEKRNTLIKAREYLEFKNGLDNWKRCLADFDNYKKRQQKTRMNDLRYAAENIITQILPVLDNFNSSLEHIPANHKDNAWVIGIMHIKKQLENILTDNGMEEIKLKAGDDFDPNTCEAIEESVSDQKNKKEEKEKENQNKIARVVLKGYRIGEKIIRPARVIVK